MGVVTSAGLVNTSYAEEVVISFVEIRDVDG